ncbi:MAG: FAD-dependent oxidoreductase, partial [Propionibacteriaceae bacterium]
HFMTPLVACVWSCDPAIALEYPARYLFSFLQHHGMLTIYNSPQWRTVTGGSHRYVEKVAASIERHGGTLLLGTKVTSVTETPHGVEVTDGNGTVHRFDAVVVATHPDQALGMLAEPTPLQTELLSAMPYSDNIAQLHTDDADRVRLDSASRRFRKPGTSRNRRSPSPHEDSSTRDSSTVFRSTAGRVPPGAHRRARRRRRGMPQQWASQSPTPSSSGDSGCVAYVTVRSSSSRLG